MKKSASKRIKNSTLVGLFFLLVITAIVVSIIVKIVLLIAHSTYDGKHQFTLEITGSNKEDEIVAFNPNLNTVSTLFVKGIKGEKDIQSLQIPIDAHYDGEERVLAQPLSKVLFGMVFRCRYPACRGLNSIDAFKLYLLLRHIRSDMNQTATLSLPVSQLDFKNVIQPLFTDETLYHESLSVAIINASGEAGLGNQLSQLLTNIGCNVVSVTSGDIQSETVMESAYGKESYTVQRLEKIVGMQPKKMQKVGLSDIVITIGEKHPML